ncbi:MMPL family transporter [Streptomyces sp. WMMC500]|uniref:MMPL family transporter n=1 Tax=Streptomyces sp. WMMC500 TaxID=3015154 RepID=UPI00248BBAC8|nr:MMPL family transporter [Streptomyces sp. WMMC500]WBB60248.1 MMPL family transporter [Streptomyces sp. WMMC500]
MTRLLGRLGGACAAHPWRTISAWLAAIAALVALAGAFGGTLHDDYRADGTAAQAGTDFLADAFPEMSGTSARVVVHGDSGDTLPADVLAEVRERLARVEGASVVDEPVLSRDGDTALFTVAYRIEITDIKGSEGTDALREAAAPAEDAGLDVELGGQVPENVTKPAVTAEMIGVGAALIILLFALRSFTAAGLPLVVAIGGLGAGFAGITLLSAATDIGNIAPTVASMVALGVGIDYALLLVGRQAEGLRAGLAPRAAAAEATATAGVSVVIAGATVLLSLFGLRLSTIGVFASFGYATFCTVIAVMAAALTLVPALCGLAGRRVLPRAERLGLVRPEQTAEAARSTGPETPRATLTERWARAVTKRPVVSGLGALVVLLALAAPILGMRTWPQDAGSQPESNTTRRAYDLVAAEYGEGANGPLQIAVDLTEVPADSLPALRDDLAATDGVAAVAPPRLNEAGDAAVVAVTPVTGPQDERTHDLLDRLRADVLPEGAEATGVVAVFADISDRLATRLWVVVPFVVGLSLVLLTVIFRAPVVALKAAVMNLLSVGAAYGVMTVAFQTDAGARLLGLPHGVPVSSWVPILMFTILFGLSMDYEVFLLSRIREDWLATGDPHGSVVRGLAATGRVITSAAAIMIAVFTGFAIDPDVTVKMVGVGMAVAVLADATIVRMVLVPATMTLLGRANWWLPRWADRLLPELHLEPPAAARPKAPDDPAAAPGDPAVTAENGGQARVPVGGGG